MLVSERRMTPKLCRFIDFAVADLGANGKSMECRRCLLLQFNPKINLEIDQPGHWA